jgi:hypothetical protein
MIKLKRFERIQDVKGYEGLYAVTTLGRVWSYRRKIWIKPWPTRCGYYLVRLCNKGLEENPSLHRLVAMAFIPNPENKSQVNHINGVKDDCKVSNLEWMTARENMQHSADMGFNKCNKLSYHEKELICHLYWTTDTKKAELAKLFTVTPSAINYIIKTYTPIVGTA